MEKQKFVVAPGVSWVNGTHVPEAARTKPILLSEKEAEQARAMGQIVPYQPPKSRKGQTAKKDADVKS